MSRTLESAKEIVAKGIQYGAWNWDDPDNVTDADVLDKAEVLVDAAKQAEAKGSVNDAVLEILFAAQVEPTSEPTREAYTRRFNQQLSSNGNAAAPVDTTTSDASSESQVAVPASEEIESIYPGYDDAKVADIKKAILASAASGDLSSEEWEKIKAYEAANEERKTILSLQPEFKQPEPEPQPAGSGAFGQDQVTNVTTGEPMTTTATHTFGSDGGGESIQALYDGEAISRAQQEGLPIPPQTRGDEVVMPIDITGTSDQELSRLATAYHSLFARTEWLISQEEGRERAAEHLEHEAHRDAYVKAYENHRSSIPEDKRGPTALDGARRLAEKDADDAEPVRKWRSRRLRHGNEVRELKALARGYDRAVWRVTEELNRRARLATTAKAPGIK